MASKLEPFVGPRPFERQDEKYFFGRDQVANELVSLIMACSSVVLYAQSGAGKTSLLKAKVLSVLEKKKDFDVLPVARVRSQDDAGDGAVEPSNVYVANALRDLSDNSLTPERRARMTFAEFLAGRPRPPRPADEFDEDEDEAERIRAAASRPRVIIFDQFEELFTLYPDRYDDRRGFFEQLRDALQQDSLLRVVFSMREDYIAELDPYAYIMPDSLRTRFRMERLRKESALQAIVRPLERFNEEVAAGEVPGPSTGLRCDVGVAEKLVDNLRTIKIHNGRDEVEFRGEFIEPVHLQIVCKALCEKMLAEGHSVITHQDLETFGNVNQALVEYFERAVAKAAREAGVNEGDLRRWFDRVLITSDNTRSTVLRGRDETAGIPNKAIDILEAERLIRAETRDSRMWYELSHDKLIEPLRESYQQWLLRQPDDEQIRLRLIARAEQWLASRRRDDTLLLNQNELPVARRWADAEGKGEGYNESLAALVEASQATLDKVERERERELALERQRLAEAETEFQKEKAAAAQREAEHAQALADEQSRSARQARRMALGLAVLFILASILTAYAFRQNALATTALADAREQRMIAEQRTKEFEVARKRAEEQAEIARTQSEEAGKQRELAETQRKEAEKQRGLAEQQAALARQAESKAAAAALAEKRERVKADLASAEAKRQRTLATASTAAAQSELMIAQQPTELEASVKRALASLTLNPSSIEGEQALRHGLALLPQLVKTIAFNPAEVAFTPDGDITALNPVQVTLYDKNGQAKYSSKRDAEEGVYSILSADGRYMAQIGKGIASIANLTDPADKIESICYGKDKPEDACGSKDDELEEATFSRDGRYLAGRASENKIRVWETRTGRRVLDLQPEYLADETLVLTPSKFIFSQDGNFIAVTGLESASVYKVESGEHLFTTPPSGREGEFDLALALSRSLSLSLSTGAAYLATAADAEVQVWDVREKSEVARWLQQSEINQVVFSPDGNQLATVNRNTVTVRESKTGREITRVAHTVPVTKVVFSPSGSLLATASEDRTTRLWDVRSGREIFRMGHETPVSTLSFSQDERYMVTGSDDVRLWDISRSGESLARYQEGSVEQTIFSPNGKLMAILYVKPGDRPAQARPGRPQPMGVKILNVLTGLEVASLPFTLNSPKAVFSPDNKYLFIFGGGKRVRAWDTNSGRLTEYELTEPAVNFAFSA
ncbi:MAG TPA: hypothetical protein VE842_17210, partial [Pyrinomonadaceae bacterium]|nr:hypothetical protein [Pyrinomonadaceae bacterium]